MRRVLLLVVLGLLVLPGGAGAITTRVIGGAAAPEAEWPFAVALETTYGTQFCGGSLVAPTWVLTAGHCRLYPASEVRAITGTDDLDGTGGQRIGAVRQVRHPGYRQVVPGAPRDDVMLVQLAEPSAAVPIALAQGDLGHRTGELLRVAGWGSTSYDPISDNFGPGSAVLRQTPVRVQDDRRCLNAYGSAAFHPQDMICASLPGRDACAGDSGGPLVSGTGPGATLVGVVSWGTGCAMRRYPGVYALVAHNRCWIDSMIAPPAAPSAIAVAAGATALTVDWAWSAPCPEAAEPTGFRLRIAETGTVVDVTPDLRRYDLTGLADGQPLTVSVTAVNANGESAPVSAIATPGPNPVIEQAADWTGYRTADVRFTLAPHGEPVRWRVQAGHALRFRDGEWQTAEPAATPQALSGAVGDLPVGTSVDVRIEVEAGPLVSATARLVLAEPERPAPLTRPHLSGRAEVGASLRCLPGRWSGTRPFAITRQWLADGRAIAGATAAVLAVRGPLVGSVISCRVTVAGPGGIARAVSDTRAVG